MGDADVISRLPNDLLVSILNRLTLKEAIATSVLSRHWETKWTFYHGHLDFEVPKGLEVGCSNYFWAVKNVLDTFELVEGGGVFDNFTIYFRPCPTILSSVDRCLQFAMGKRRFKRLEVASYFSPGCGHYGGSYGFSPLKCLYAQPRNILMLTYIHFESVNVSSEIIELFLSNCPVLQTLVLINSLLNYLKVSGESLSLEHLTVSDCPRLTTIEISAPNLLSLKYFNYVGSTIAKFYVGNVPKLVELSIGPPTMSSNPVKTYMGTLVIHLLSYFPHIQKLMVYICNEEPGDLTKLTELRSLKHLTLNFVVSNAKNILAWTSLLKPFPFLQKLTIDMQQRLDNGINVCVDDLIRCKFPSKCLKEFEFLGFGKPTDFTLVLCLLKNIATLEKIIVCCDSGGPYYFEWNKDCVEASKRVAELKEIIPKEVKFEFSGCNGLPEFDILSLIC